MGDGALSAVLRVGALWPLTRLRLRPPPGFVSHQAVARTAGNVLIRLADSLVLPLNCSDYAESLEAYLETAVDLYQDQLKMWNISMGNQRTYTIGYWVMK